MVAVPDLQLDILLYPDDGGFLAHCLQLDLVEWGETLDEAHCALLDVVRAHVESVIENDNLDHLFHPAPAEVWKRFFGATLIAERPLALDLPAGDVFPIRVREASVPCAAA